ncbi:hypothetical protein NMG60_11015104 [Bertholletia excelsa]
MNDQQLFPPDPLFCLSNGHDGSYMHNASNSIAFDGTILPSGTGHARSYYGVQFQFQSSEVCPKNFIIFDQTENRSQIMFNPAVAPNFCYPDLNIHSSYIHDNIEKKENTGKDLPSSRGEDSDDIDALLSLEEEEMEDCDDEEVSTARTQGNYESDSSDCSSYGSKPKKTRNPLLRRSSGCGTSYNSEKKREKMRKMVKALRGIVPGGNGMNTAVVLDEAVKYLKSLKGEVQKLGVGNLK